MSDMIERLNTALEGRYEVERQIGEGGMAWVYLATDIKHRRQVALKILKPDLSASLGADRFLEEIRTTAGLQHPHILPLFDSGEADGFLFYVMPFVEGETLGQRLKRERQLPIDEAIRIATAVARALHTAHVQGIVHRDVKPGNILMSGREPLVADFGIAVALGVASGGRHTETGVSIGTPFYMSPEQAAGDEAIGPATDVFSLACVLYEMLVGEPPYTGSTAQAVLGKILTGAPVSSTGVRKTVPINVDAALRRALEKVPADRFKSAADFADALANRSFRHGEWKLGSRRAGEQRWKGIAGVASAVAVLAIGFALTREGAPPPEPVERFLLAADALGSPTLLPDGTGVVYSAPDSNGIPELRIRRWEGLEASPIPGTGGRLVGTPTVSPDGTRVAFHRDGDLLVADLRTGDVRTAASDVDCCTRWAEDGHLYYTAGSARNIMRVLADGGTPEAVTSSDDMAGREGDFHLMDDGDTGLFTVWANPPRLEAIRLSTGERRPVVDGLKSFEVGDDRIVYATMDGELHSAEFDVRSMSLQGDPVQVATGIYIDLRNYPVYSVTPSGALAYVTVAEAANMSPVWVNRDGSRAPVDANLTYDPAGNGPLAISRDGRRLAFSINRGDRTDIWVKDISRAQAPLQRLTSDGLTNDRPTWMPDGQSLLYLGRAPGTRAIYSLRADGGQARELVLDNADFRLLGGEVSADGQWLIYRQGQDQQDLSAGTGASDVMAYDLQSGGEPVAVAESEFDERAPAMSPDGRWVAYVSDRAGQDEVYVRPFPDAGRSLVQVSPDGGSEPAWSADGSELFFRDGAMRMVAASVSGGEDFGVTDQRVLFPTEAYQSSRTTRTYQVHPDGRFLMMLRSDTGESIVLVQNWGQVIDQRASN